MKRNLKNEDILNLLAARNCEERVKIHTIPKQLRFHHPFNVIVISTNNAIFNPMKWSGLLRSVNYAYCLLPILFNVQRTNVFALLSNNYTIFDPMKRSQLTHSINCSQTTPIPFSYTSATYWCPDYADRAHLPRKMPGQCTLFWYPVTK